MTYAIYTDGACEPNPGPGGWAAIAFLDDTEIHRDCGSHSRTTNNIMELTAVFWALDQVSRFGWHGATIYSDSKYVVNGCNDWRHKWKAAGWRKPAANREIWRDMDRMLSILDDRVRIEWVKGHSGIPGNELADEISMQAMRDCVATERLYVRPDIFQTAEQAP